MAAFGSTPSSSEIVHIGLGGDLTFLKGMVRALFEHEAGGEAVLDHAFIAEHTAGLDALRADIMAQSWAEIVAVSGIAADQIRRCAAIYGASRATMICYGMGITQHRKSSQLVQQRSEARRVGKECVSP